MKNKASLIVSISNMSDLDKITKDTKYINLDITNPSDEVMAYFIKNGSGYMYGDLILTTIGYNYVSYDDFVKAENIVDMIFSNMPRGLDKLAIAKYIYVTICKYVSLDIDTDQSKNEVYNSSLISTINNLWGSLALGIVGSSSMAKIYYYLCRKVGIDVGIIMNENSKNEVTKLLIDNQVLLTDLYSDIPYIKCKMKTRFFDIYNNDIVLDKRIGYLKGNYTDDKLDRELRDIAIDAYDYVSLVLEKTLKIIDMNEIKPMELSVIYRYIFDRYCPNYNIKINNLFLNRQHKLHFIMISYDDIHYSYNYRENMFINVSDEDIIDNIAIGKIGLYQGESIPNINYAEFMRRNC